MYNVIHIDHNGCEYEIGEYDTENEARASAENNLRTFCSLHEQIDHFIVALHISPENPISELMAAFQETDNDMFTETIEEYCDSFNDYTKDVMQIIGPDKFDVYYWAELTYDAERGFFYEITCNG
jgi:hypothetical protein